MLPYRRIHLTHRLNYEDRSTCKPGGKKLHLGQLKLLMSEILFLAKTAKGGETVIYVGAAEGYHIYKLAEMFPNIKFELWDGRDFDIDPHPNIQKNKSLFTNNHAQQYAKRQEKGEKFLFISDIRNMEFGRVKKIKDKGEKLEADKKIIGGDMRMQMEWCQIINPEWAYLKFRLPYAQGVSDYLSGKIYLQPYSPKSTETRLLTQDYDTLVEYDNLENDGLMAYFNCNIRFDPLDDHRWNKVMDNYGIKPIWDNYIAFYILAYYLEKINNKPPEDKEVAELFNVCINFHRKKYGDRYDYLYTD